MLGRIGAVALRKEITPADPGANRKRRPGTTLERPVEQVPSLRKLGRRRRWAATTRRSRSRSTGDVVFFLGGGFLELSGYSQTGPSESVGLWLQVRDVEAVGHELEGAGVDNIEPPTDKPWGYARCRYETRTD